MVDAQEPPPVDNLGNAAGFSFRLQDRANRGYAALLSAQEQLLKLAQQSPILQKVKIEGLPPTPQAELVIDREKAAALGVKFEDINATIQLNLGSVYPNDFPNRGKMQRVYVQAEQLQLHLVASLGEDPADPSLHAKVCKREVVVASEKSGSRTHGEEQF